MNNPKNLLLIALIFLGFLLYVEWQKDYAPQPQAEPQQQATGQQQEIPQSNTSAAINDVPEIKEQNSDVPKQEAVTQTRNSGQLITVTTNVLKLKIDTIGASVVYAELLDYPVKKKSENNIILFNKSKNDTYYAQSGLTSSQQSFFHTEKFNFEKTEYKVISGSVEIPFTTEQNGIKLTKTYIIDADSYLINLTDHIENNSSELWRGQKYNQLQRNNPWLNKETSFSDSGRMSFKGAGYFDPDDGYNKLAFDDFSDPDEKVDVTINSNGWIAMVQHYFFTGFILKDKSTEITSKYLPTSETPYIIRARSENYQVNPGSSLDIASELYVGPKMQEHLPEISKGLDLTVDYGMFTAIAKPLFWILNHIHSLVGNWGWSIILLTVLVKLAFFKLTEKQYNSMARMRKLQPRIKILRERYKDNRQKFNEEMMKMYKQEKVNPMGGCLPMLVQIPVFIALYWVLLESVELRQAPFILWLQDLSTPDPYFILPAINAFAMIMTQRLSPAVGMDPMQEKIMKIMPVAFSVMFAFFQSGLVLYWAVNSSLSLVQQWVITKRIEAKG